MTKQNRKKKNIVYKCIHLCGHTCVLHYTVGCVQFEMQIFLLFFFFHFHLKICRNKNKLNINNAIVFLVHLQNCICFEFFLHLHELVLHSTNLKLKRNVLLLCNRIDIGNRKFIKQTSSSF